ncbi:MAG: hypothetical protein ACR2NY_00895 [Alphaproteobacteria bacterium]
MPPRPRIDPKAVRITHFYYEQVAPIFKGHIFTSKEINDVIKQIFSNANKSRLQLADHIINNKPYAKSKTKEAWCSCCNKSNALFEKIAHDRYKVRSGWQKMLSAICLTCFTPKKL